MPKTRRLSDATLVRRSQQGDRRAFRALVGRYDRRLRGLAFALLLDRGEMDTALGIGYLRAWRDVVRIKPKDDVGAWLYRVTYNACIDRLRHVDGATTPAAATTESPAGRLVAGLASLRAVERVAVVLVDREGFSPASAARILGLAPAALADTLETARERLTPYLPAPPAPAAEASTSTSAAAPGDDAAGGVAGAAATGAGAGAEGAPSSAADEAAAPAPAVPAAHEGPDDTLVLVPEWREHPSDPDAAIAPEAPPDGEHAAGEADDTDVPRVEDAGAPAVEPAPTASAAGNGSGDPSVPDATEPRAGAGGAPGDAPADARADAPAADASGDGEHRADGPAPAPPGNGSGGGPDVTAADETGDGEAPTERPAAEIPGDEGVRVIAPSGEAPGNGSAGTDAPAPAPAAEARAGGDGRADAPAANGNGDAHAEATPARNGNGNGNGNGRAGNRGRGRRARRREKHAARQAQAGGGDPAGDDAP